MLSADAMARRTGRSMTIGLVFPETVLFYIGEGQSQGFMVGKDLPVEARSHFLPPRPK